MTRTDFQSQVDDFIVRHRISRTTFGLWAMNDSRFYFDLWQGRLCYQDTMKKVCAFMASYDAKQEAKRLRTLSQR